MTAVEQRRRAVVRKDCGRWSVTYSVGFRCLPTLTMILTHDTWERALQQALRWTEGRA